MKSSITLIAGCSLMGIAPLALAHTGATSLEGFAAGLQHPFLGVDHVLTMLAVGLWAAHLGGGALWRLPISFASLMLAGALLHSAGLRLPSADLFIALSLAFMGMLLLARERPSLPVTCALAGLFGVFHGYVHAAELSSSGSLLSYGAGFLLATLLLQTSGLLLGFIMQRLSLKRLFRLFAALCTGSGLYLLLRL